LGLRGPGSIRERSEGEEKSQKVVHKFRNKKKNRGRKQSKNGKALCLVVKGKQARKNTGGEGGEKRRDVNRPNEKQAKWIRGEECFLENVRVHGQKRNGGPTSEWTRRKV